VYRWMCSAQRKTTRGGETVTPSVIHWGLQSADPPAAPKAGARAHTPVSFCLCVCLSLEALQILRHL
jgi:hypothetical protein